MKSEYSQDVSLYNTPRHKDLNITVMLRLQIYFHTELSEFH